MTEYISNLQRNLNIGISSYTENETVLRVIGDSNLSGNLGIGTTNPTSKLYVEGDGYFTGVVTATKFYGDGSSLTGIEVSGAISISTNTTNSNQLITYSTGFGNTTGLGATTSLVYNPSSGTLGIGTTNPTSKLDVVGDGKFTGVVTATKFYGDGSALIIKLDDLADFDETNKNDKYIIMYDAVIQKYKLVNPDEVLSASSNTETTQPGLPSDFLNTLDTVLDNRIDLDAGTF